MRPRAYSTRDRFADNPYPIRPGAKTASAVDSTHAPVGEWDSKTRASGIRAPASAAAPSIDASSTARVDAAAVSLKSPPPRWPATPAREAGRRGTRAGGPPGLLSGLRRVIPPGLHGQLGNAVVAIGTASTANRTTNTAHANPYSTSAPEWPYRLASTMTTATEASCAMSARTPASARASAPRADPRREPQRGARGQVQPPGEHERGRDEHDHAQRRPAGQHVLRERGERGEMVHVLLADDAEPGVHPDDDQRGQQRGQRGSWIRRWFCTCTWFGVLLLRLALLPVLVACLEPKQ